jgi:ABC-type Fe3+-hydroxamate transport system substrate-binding protein
MKYFCHYFLILTALGALFCSCGGGHNGGISGEAGEPEFLRIADIAEGGWTIVSVSPFDGSADTLVVDKPMTNIIVMSTSHYGFLDAIGRTDIISGVSGPDYLWINSEQKTAEASSGGSTASLCEAPPLASLRSAPVPPLTVPRVAWVSPSRLASAAYTIITGFTGGAAAGLASPDHGRPRHARGRGPDRWRGSENLFSQTLREMGGAERSEESGLSEPAAACDSVKSKAVEPPELAAHANGRIADVGYDSAPDYETIVALRPEVVLTYAVSGVESPFVGRLKQLGIRVLTVNEHLERHPLARAAYIRLFGALTGDMEAADSVLSVVKSNYEAITKEVISRRESPRKVLLNIPYNDQWFVPASDNYLTVMIHDAGGIVLGCEEGKAASTVMSVEKAYSLSKEADSWLNVGWCSTEKDLLGVNPIFSDMLDNIKKNAEGRVPGGTPIVWNDNKRANDKGGNDIWQSGAVRPDLILRDLAAILHPDEETGIKDIIYYKPII